METKNARNGAAARALECARFAAGELKTYPGMTAFVRSRPRHEAARYALDHCELWARRAGIALPGALKMETAAEVRAAGVVYGLTLAGAVRALARGTP